MLKRFISFFLILLISCSPAFAKKHHRSKRGHRTHKTYRTSRAKKVQPKRPAITLNEINPAENVWGIDVSHHQSVINWELLSKQKPNFVFIKASEGVTHQDTQYQTNYSEAKKQGLLVGSYHFFSYQSGGKEQANNFLATAKHSSGDLLPVLDAEFHKKMPAKELVSSELTSFINTIYDQLGHYPIVYCNYTYYLRYLKDYLPQQCKLWIVDYQKRPDCDWTFWQKTDRLKIQGVAGFVDLNMFNGPAHSLNDMIFKDGKN